MRSWLVLGAALAAGGCASRPTQPPGAPPTSTTITREEPGGDAHDPELAALDRLLVEGWGMRQDRRMTVSVPLTDARTWRRVRYWTVETLTGFRFGDAHHGMAAIFLRDAPPDADADACMRIFEEWAGPIARGLDVTIGAPVVTRTTHAGRALAVRSRDASLLWGTETRVFAGVYAAYAAWPGKCLVLGYAFPNEPRLQGRGAQVRDRYAREAFGRLAPHQPPP